MAIPSLKHIAVIHVAVYTWIQFHTTTKNRSNLSPLLVLSPFIYSNLSLHARTHTQRIFLFYFYFYYSDRWM